MKILQISDGAGWAIDSLAQAITKHLNNRFQIKTINIHPRDVLGGQQYLYKAIEQGVDLIHFHYWRTATQLLELDPQLKRFPLILSHWNHESLGKGDWKDFDCLTHPTRWGFDKLSLKHPSVKLIPMGIDLDRFSFIQDYKPEPKTIGYVGRIVPWKNLHKICAIAEKLGYKVIATGYIDKADYYKKEVEKYVGNVLELNGGMGRGEMMPAIFKDNMYKRMSVFCMYSTDECESGTLPMMEAMARGVPVLATWQGTVRDRGVDGENLVIFDETNFEERLKRIMEDEKLRESLRTNAWKTAKGFPEEKMAWEFGKLYYKVYSEKK